MPNMAEARTREVEVPGNSVRGVPRMLTLTPGQPGRVALTIYIQRKPVTVVVPVARLQAALAEIPR
jgi:hypothetical protein